MAGRASYRLSWFFLLEAMCLAPLHLTWPDRLAGPCPLQYIQTTSFTRPGSHAGVMMQYPQTDQNEGALSIRALPHRASGFSVAGKTEVVH